MSPSALLTVCTKSRSLPVKTFTAKKFHLHHPAQKPDHGARQGRGQGRARQAWAVPKSGHKLPQLSDAKRVWRQGLSGVTFPSVAATEEGKVTALEQCLVLVRGTQRSQASEGVATQKGLHSLVPAPGGAGGRRELPPVLGRDLPVSPLGSTSSPVRLRASRCRQPPPAFATCLVWASQIDTKLCTLALSPLPN